MKRIGAQRGAFWFGLVVVILLGLGAMVLGGLVGYWLFMNIATTLVVKNSPMTVIFPPSLDVQAKTLSSLKVRMKGNLHAKIPFRQNLPLHFKGTYRVRIRYEGDIPINTTLTYKGVLPIDTYADISAVVTGNFRNLKKYRNVRIKARLPMKLDAPITLTVPVNQPMHIVLDIVAPATFDQTVQLPVDTVIKSILPVDQDFTLPVRNTFGLRIGLPQTPVKGTIAHATLKIPMTTVRFEEKGAAAQDAQGHDTASASTATH